MVWVRSNLGGKAVVAYERYFPTIFLEGLRKTTIYLNRRNRSQIWDVPNAQHKRQSRVCGVMVVDVSTPASVPEGLGSNIDPETGCPG
jgi:hypothetical protein